MNRVKNGTEVATELKKNDMESKQDRYSTSKPFVMFAIRNWHTWQQFSFCSICIVFPSDSKTFLQSKFAADSKSFSQTKFASSASNYETRHQSPSLLDVSTCKLSTHQKSFQSSLRFVFPTNLQRSEWWKTKRRDSGDVRLISTLEWWENPSSFPLWRRHLGKFYLSDWLAKNNDPVNFMDLWVSLLFSRSFFFLPSESPKNFVLSSTSSSRPAR